MSRWRELARSAQSASRAEIANTAKTPDQAPTSRGFGNSGSFGTGSPSPSGAASVTPPTEFRQSSAGPDNQQAWDVEAELETIEERAGILQFDAGIPRAWAEGAARLLARLPTPRGCDPARWDQLRDDAAGLIADGWVSKAAALGWDSREMFGAMPGRPDVRHDAQGLAWTLRGRMVVTIDASGADIATPSGGRTRFYRRPADDPRPPHSISAWDLPAHDDI